MRVMLVIMPNKALSEILQLDMSKSRREGLDFLSLTLYFGSVWTDGGPALLLSTTGGPGDAEVTEESSV